MKLDLEKHIAILGNTNSGKTTFAKELFKNRKTKSIFINTNEENVPGYQTNEFSEELLKHDKVVLNNITEEKISNVWDTIQQISKELKNDREIYFSIFVDEVQMFASNLENSVVIDMLKRSYRHHTNIITISQRPQAVHKAILDQMSYYVIFYVPMRARDYFLKNYDVSKFPKEQYQFVICDSLGNSSETMTLCL